jgi:serine/threonine protein kinase
MIKPIKSLERLVLPPNLSKAAINLLSKLLEKSPEARLGANNISVLKKHIFFAEINWEKLL